MDSLETQQVELDRQCVDTIRMLSIDAVQKAKSGHPGTPLDAAPVAYCLWQRYLTFDPDDSAWLNRDRFVLSAGHASMLLYSLLYLCGVKGASKMTPATDAPAVTMEDIQSFRQEGSHCTGHPEHGWTAGVETTTGPLGQGVSTSVGMAIAERWLAATYNRPGFEIFNYRVYAFCSDGDMMEGVSSEAASIAGHLKLSNLCWIYDDNRITIEGSTGIAFTEDVGARFLAYGWNVTHVADANDLGMIARALEAARQTTDRPTLIIVRSHIGYGSPHKQDTAAAHGEPLGVDEVRLVKQFYGWNPDENFHVPDGVIAHFRANMGERGKRAHAAWTTLFGGYRNALPALAAEIDALSHRKLPDGWDADLPNFPADEKGLATRDSSGKVLNAIAAHVPWLLGGAADLSPSTKTNLTFDSSGDFQPPGDAPHAGEAGNGGNYGGRNFHFGIREHAMCAIASGMCLSKLRSYASSFFIFTDYCRGAIRLSAMMELPVIYVWTHDSISMGEDGPTHQPIEQLASFRAMPGMVLIRPADANEVVEAWKVVMGITDRPVSLVLTRQAVPTLDRSSCAPASGLARGAYVLADAKDGTPDLILISSGSEVSLCMDAHKALTAEGVRVRVVSMPSWQLFEAEDQAYRDSVLPPAVHARVAVEEGSTFGWERYTGMDGAILGLTTFGLSAPLKVISSHFGFTSERVIEMAKAQLKRHGSGKGS